MSDTSGNFKFQWNRENPIFLVLSLLLQVLHLPLIIFSWILQGFQRSDVWPTLEPGAAFPSTKSQPANIKMSFIFWRYPGYFASWIFHSGLFLWKSVWDPQSVRKLRYLNDKDFCRLVEESFWALMMRKVDPEEGIESRFTASQTTPGSSLEYYQLGSWTELKLIDNLPYHGIYTYDFSAQFVLRVDKEIERGYAHSGPRLSLDWIELGGRRFQPDDGDAWEQAKVFVFHGCFSFSTWFYHSRIHFPLDAFNALARNILPHKGVVGRLLGPHLQLQVELDNAVLFGALSPLASEKFYLPYNSSIVPRHIHWRVLNEGGCPTPVNTRKPLQFDENFRYGRWLTSYYTIVLDYVRTIVEAAGTRDEQEIRTLFTAVNRVSPNFPTGPEVAADQNLIVYVLANFIFTVSFWHSGDHYSNSEYAGNTAVVHRPRCPGPHEASLSAKEFASRVQTVGDWYKQFQLIGVYGDYLPSFTQNLTLMKTSYDLPADFRAIESSFRSALVANEKRLIATGDNIMPLAKVVRCISF